MSDWYKKSWYYNISEKYCQFLWTIFSGSSLFLVAFLQEKMLFCWLTVTISEISWIQIVSLCFHSHVRLCFRLSLGKLLKFLWMLCFWIHNYLAIQVKTPKRNLQAYESCKIGSLGYVRAKTLVQMDVIHRLVPVSSWSLKKGEKALAMVQSLWNTVHFDYNDHRLIPNPAASG